MARPPHRRKPRDRRQIKRQTTAEKTD
ncbi:uncharacterized protein G2W53_043671 [Senna tora]|uniref:Uncharacterized protein n=1 Tax=Senna tora TaxID=362788 RepID=A0A834W0P2_9FABA|nr:uncharacterized protein G2W53_043671 [Senna tora]